MTPYLNKECLVVYFTPCKCFFSRTGTNQDHLSCLSFNLCSVYVLGFRVVFSSERHFLSEYERTGIDSANHVAPAIFNHLVEPDLTWIVQN